jgi:hypothetical protein|tara:strand:+ start:2440 stop:2577 length:138 start_codon:yes stop_codon:yes gene_type:complete
MRAANFFKKIWLQHEKIKDIKDKSAAPRQKISKTPKTNNNPNKNN